MHKQSGTCWQCGAVQWEDGEPQAKWRGRRVGVLLLDRTHMDLTVCEACTAVFDAELVWWKVMHTWNNPALTAAQLGNCILGVLYTLPWTEVDPVVRRVM